MSQKKILVVVQNDLLGGAEQLLKLLATEYAASGNEVKVIIMRAPMQGNWDHLKNEINIQYINTKTYFPGILKLAWFLIWFTRKHDFDRTFSSNININAVLGFMKKLRLLKTKKLIIRETTSVFLRIKGMKKYIHTVKYVVGYSSADLIICQTDVMRDQFLDHLKSSRKWKMKTIQNPVDIEKVLRLSTEPMVDNFERKFIVSAGRFITEKGFDILIKAFASLSKEFPQYDLVILGDGKMKPEYESLIAQLHLEKNVILPGFKSNPMPYFKHAELCVVSSRFEGFPNVLLQMAALNDRVVSTLCAGNIASIPAIFTCETNDADLLAETMKKALNHLPDESELNAKFAFLNAISISSYVSTLENLIDHA